MIPWMAVSEDFVQMIVTALIVLGAIIIKVVKTANKWINEKRMLGQDQSQARSTQPQERSDGRAPESDDPETVLMRELERALRGEAEERHREPTSPQPAPDGPSEETPLERMAREAEDVRQTKEGRPREIGADRPFQMPAAPAKPPPVRGVPMPAAMRSIEDVPEPAYRPRPGGSAVSLIGISGAISGDVIVSSGQSAYDIRDRGAATRSLAIFQNSGDIMRGIVAQEILSPPRSRSVDRKRRP